MWKITLPLTSFHLEYYPELANFPPANEMQKCIIIIYA